MLRADVVDALRSFCPIRPFHIHACARNSFERDLEFILLYQFNDEAYSIRVILDAKSLDVLYADRFEDTGTKVE